MSIFDDSHVTDIGLEGSAGPSVSFFDTIRQGFRQQYIVDSQMALDTELENRWKESLRALEMAGGGKFALPVDPLAFRGYAQYIKGQPITVFPHTVRGDASQARTNPYEVLNAEIVANARPEDNLRDIIRANEAIKKLNNPAVKSFEAILDEVAQMQHGVEQESVSVYERSGTTGILGNLLGAIGGSFTTRDPLNLVTAPIGAGRTIAARVATDMAVAAGVVTATEYGDVAPNRALVGLPERNHLFNIAAATLGAGAIRGGLEGIGVGVRTLRDRAGSRTSGDLDLNDSQLAQMFDSSSTNPSIRAGARALDDAEFIERNNPFGDGPAAQERFLAELRQVQRAMDAEPMTAVARVMPEMPFKYLEKQGDFQFVKEQAPELYARMEAAQAKLVSLNEQTKVTPEIIGRDELRTLGTGDDGVNIYRAVNTLEDRIDEALTRGDKVTLYADGKPIEITQPGLRDASGQRWGVMRIFTANNTGNRLEIVSNKILEGKVGQAKVNQSKSQPEIIDASNLEPRHTDKKGFLDLNAAGLELRQRVKEALDRGDEVKLVVEGKSHLIIGTRTLGLVDEKNQPWGAAAILMARPGDNARVEINSSVNKTSRKTANKEYRTAYRAVEAEAERLRAKRDAIEAEQQRQGFNILADPGRPFDWTTLRHDSVATRVDAINAASDTLDEAAEARFTRPPEGDETVAREAWQTDEGIDIGLKQPVDPDFRIITDEGEITVAQAMRDLQDDADLNAAMRTCLL